MNFRLLDSSHEPVDDVAGVRLLESVNADKSLWCRLNLSFRLLMNYVLLTAAGEHMEPNCFLDSGPLVQRSAIPKLVCRSLYISLPKLVIYL